MRSTSFTLLMIVAACAMQCNGTSRPTTRVGTVGQDAAAYASVDISPRTLTLSPFHTDAVDRDNDDASDGVDLFVMPEDAYGDTVKVVGTFEVSLYQKPAVLFPQLGQKGRLLETWSVGPVEANKAWRDSTFDGYLFRLSWHDKLPDANKCILEVVLTLGDGTVLVSDELTLTLEHG